jgi:hypothetical protein
MPWQLGSQQIRSYLVRALAAASSLSFQRNGHFTWDVDG